MNCHYCEDPEKYGLLPAEVMNIPEANYSTAQSGVKAHKNKFPLRDQPVAAVLCRDV
jgi:hypothetical protein